MIIKSNNILTPDFSFKPDTLAFSDTIGESGSDTVLDCEDCYVIPGLVDVHTHGALGFDANDKTADYATWQAFLLSKGVTTFLPTTVTDTHDNLIAAFDRLSGATGINMEGPYLSAEKKGAHDPALICPVDTDFLDTVKDRVKIVTVAPEVAGNSETIQKITELGIRVSIGHSNATYEEAQSAIGAGATQITHIFNCCPPLLHRAPGLIGAAFDSDSVFCEVIGDGLHLHPSIVRMVYRQLGADRMVLISDAIAATGLCDGTYRLGGLEVFVKHREARLADGTIAGSTVTLYDVLCRTVGFGVPLEDAVKMATATPAKALGLSGVGSLQPGYDADILVLNQDLTIRHVFYKGKQIQ